MIGLFLIPVIHTFPRSVQITSYFEAVVLFILNKKNIFKKLIYSLTVFIYLSIYPILVYCKLRLSTEYFKL